MLLATLTQKIVDQPWTICAFEPTAAYEDVRPLFERLVAIVDGPTFDAEAWEAARLALKENGIVLQEADREPTVEDFGINIRGDEAWLRY